MFGGAERCADISEPSATGATAAVAMNWRREILFICATPRVVAHCS
jgi:hypothetical protein